MRNPSIILVTCFLLLSCVGANRYEVRFDTASSQYDGYQVYLVSPTANSLEGALNMGKIEKGRCLLEGVLDTADWHLLVLKHPEKTELIEQLLYLDGRVETSINGNKLVISGSNVNKAYQQFVNEYDRLSANVEAIDKKLATDLTNTTLQHQLAIEYQVFKQSFRKMALSAIKNNLNNPAGVQLLKSSASILENADIENILSLGSSSFLAHPFIKELSSQLGHAKRVAIGQLFVDMVLFTPQGDTVTLSDYAGRGQYVLVDFWASWCGPCMRELPNVLACYNEYHKKGFEIVGVSLDESAKDWEAAIAKLKLPWAQLSDLSGWKSVAVTQYAVSSIPHTVLIDPKGFIVQKDLRGEGLKEALASIYDGK